MVYVSDPMLTFATGSIRWEEASWSLDTGYAFPGNVSLYPPRADSARVESTSVSVIIRMAPSEDRAFGGRDSGTSVIVAGAPSPNSSYGVTSNESAPGPDASYRT